jgi:hypothetical protein
MGSAAAKPRVERLMPDLVPLAPENVLGPETGFEMTLGVDAPVMVDGCFLDERVRKGAQRCLRFDGIAANSGTGPLEVAYGPDPSRTDISAFQRIFNSDGTYKDRFATNSEFHPTHAHFHIQDFYVARLWASSGRGGIVGSEPVANGDKNGFCPEDSAPIEGEERGGGNYSCFTDGERSGPETNQVVGISAGWKDIYRYGLPDQFVEISGLGDGYYALELELDPNNVFRESNETNNSVCVVLRLEGTSAKLAPSLSC